MPRVTSTLRVLPWARSSVTRHCPGVSLQGTFCSALPHRVSIRTGFSLVRKIVEREGLDWNRSAPFNDVNLARLCLRPTRIYVLPLMAAIRTGAVHGLAHITGGGLTENIPRMLPDGLGAEVNLKSWRIGTFYRWLLSTAGTAEEEALRTFNCGIGMVAAVAPEQVDALARLMAENGETTIRIGRVVEGNGISYSGVLL